jgi:hypothetical protein
LEVDGNETPRVAVGTVPGTVREVVQAVIRTCSRTAIQTPTSGSKTSGTARALLGPNSAATAGLRWKENCRRSLAVTRDGTPAATLAAFPVVVCEVIRSVIR